MDIKMTIKKVSGKKLELNLLACAALALTMIGCASAPTPAVPVDTFDAELDDVPEFVQRNKFGIPDGTYERVEMKSALFSYDTITWKFTVSGKNFTWLITEKKGKNPDIMRLDGHLAGGPGGAVATVSDGRALTSGILYYRDNYDGTVNTLISVNAASATQQGYTEATQYRANKMRGQTVPLRYQQSQLLMDDGGKKPKILRHTGAGEETTPAAVTGN
ncbi:MAG: hypothetical protein LBK60_01195 [Verrucomicrobiales bacterium]|jgi:hypothetical protein|nr:hypothetical protein [Verrucomicrobiales bacterium]